MKVTDEEIKNALRDALMAFDADQRQAFGVFYDEEKLAEVARTDKIARTVDAMACLAAVRKLIGQAAK